MQSKKFKNWTNEDFSWKFDGIEYTFPAGQETYLEDFKADHFAKHLTDREINRMNVDKGLAGKKDEIPTSNAQDRTRLTALCFPSTETVTPEVALNINEEVKAKKKKVEPEFEDLKIVKKKKV